MKDNAALLQDLIVASEHALGLRSPGEPAAVATLVDEIAAAVNRPADIERVMHDYTSMLACSVMLAAKVIRYRGAHQAPVYFRVIGTILPDVRADFGRAIEQRKRPTA